MWLTTTSNYLLLVIHFVRRIQLWLDTLRFCNHILLTRALAHRLSVRRTPQSRYLSFRFQEIRWLRLRIAADEIVRERSNWKVSLSGAFSPSLIHLPTLSPCIFLCISLSCLTFLCPFLYHIIFCAFSGFSTMALLIRSILRLVTVTHLVHMCHVSVISITSLRSASISFILSRLFILFSHFHFTLISIPISSVSFRFLLFRLFSRLEFVIHLVPERLYTFPCRFLSFSLRLFQFSYIIRFFSTFVVNFANFVEFCLLGVCNWL